MRFIVQGTKYELDQAKITFAEARKVEQLTGKTMAAIAEASSSDVMTLQALVFVAMKRVNPELRFTDLDDMPMGDLEMLPEDDEEESPDPTQAASGAEVSTPSE